MTPNEAYNYATFRAEQMLKGLPITINSERELEMLFAARAALQKQIHVKPKTVTISKVLNEPIQVDVCPACGCDNILKYCQNCGQAIETETEE